METKRIALLIGISDYQSVTSLNNPVNDIDSMEIVLRKLGFDVIALKNLEFKEFRIALDEFADKLNDYDVGLFYFAGHGIQVKGINYLIAADSNPKSENQVEYDCINANLILSLMEDGSNSINFIFLDACRNNPFKRSWNRTLVVEGLSYMSAPYGTLIAYSTAPDKTASDGDGLNGLYTSVLIDEIISPNLTIIQVLQNVRLALIKKTKGGQVPWESTSLINDFVFNDNRYFSLSTFCKSILYSEDRDIVFNSLKLNLWDKDVKQVVRSGTPLQSIDSQAGVIEVYHKSKVNYFDIFNAIEAKIYITGERDYYLFTTTKDYNKVISLSKELYKTLGIGLYNDERHASFKNLEKIKDLALGKANKSIDEVITFWSFKHVSFSLKYLIKPQKRLLIFMVSVKPKKQVIKKTICSVLKNDFNSLISSSEIVDKVDKKDGFFEDYFTKLKKLEFDYFDNAIIRVFSTSKTFYKSSNLFLSCINPEINIEKLSTIISELTLIYGVDDYGEGYLTGEEFDLIKNNRYWSGRSWDLNIQHQKYDSESNGEEMLYQIQLRHDSLEEGLQLDIIGYKSLMKYNAESINDKDC